MKHPYHRFLSILFIAIFGVMFTSCETLKKLATNESVAELVAAFKDAPLVLETVYKGKVVRVVLRKGEAIAVTEEGVKVPMEEISKADQ